MTITLRVRQLLHNPKPFIKGFRLGVRGALLLSDDEFRIFHIDEAGLDESISLLIDAPHAATTIREALTQPPPGAWWYFGQAMVEAWTRSDAGGWVLHELVSVLLEELGGERPVCIKVRPHPWGWDQLE
jgi:hypothetical protein